MAQRKHLNTGGARRRRGTKRLPIDEPMPQQNWSERRSEPIDAEVIDDEQDEQFRQRRQSRRERARSFFGKKTHDKQHERQRQHQVDDERANADDEDMSEQERLLKLRSETRLAGQKYMDSLRDAKLFTPGFDDPKSQDLKLSALQQVHVQMMMQSCMRPLLRGVRPTSVIQAVGMMTAMRMLSPEFKQESNRVIQPLKDKLQDRVDRKTKRRGQAAQMLADRHNEWVDHGTAERLKKSPDQAMDDGFISRREGKKVDRDTYLSKKWRQRMSDMEHRERGHREMYTPESAAMTEVGLMENAFWQMRDGQHDPDQVHKSYKAMRNRLHQQMSDDGLDRQEVVDQARQIIGDRMEYEPELRLMFNGMAHGRINKAAPHAEQVAGTDTVHQVWSGEFEDQHGSRMSKEGMFTLRAPMGADDHEAQMAQAMEESFSDALRRGDDQALGNDLMGYTVGFAARGRQADVSGVWPRLGKRVEQTDTMIASMAIDGIPEEEQRRVYSNSFVDAIEQTRQKHPEFEEKLQRALGEDWQQTMEAAVNDPEKFYREQKARAEAGGPTTSGQTHEQADFSQESGFSPDASEDSDYQPA